MFRQSFFEPERAGFFVTRENTGVMEDKRRLSNNVSRFKFGGRLEMKNIWSAWMKMLENVVPFKFDTERKIILL